MNQFIMSKSDDTWGKEKGFLNIYDTQSFEDFIKKLKSIDSERQNAGLVVTGGTKIANTLDCFSITFSDHYHDTFILKDLSSINNKVFNNEKSDMDIFLWLAKEMTETIQEMLDENKRYGDGFSTQFLEKTRDFLLLSYVKPNNYVLNRK